MAKLVTFLFDTNADSANNGKIVVTMQNTDPSPGTPYDFYIGITSPSGEEIKALPTDTPDATIDGGADDSDTFNVDIPLDANGDYLEGTYTFYTRRDDNGADDTTVTDTYLFTATNAPDNLSGTPTLVVAFNCLTGKITATDTTDYDALGLTLNERVITLTPPSLDSQGVVTSGSATASMTVAFTNVTYQVSLFADFESASETDLGDDVSVSAQGSLTLYEEVNVECETGGICASLECIGDELDKVHNQACAAGGYHNLSGTIKDKMTWAMLNLTMAKFQYDCGNVSLSETYLTRAKEGINCGCGCTDSTSDSTPAPYTPPYVVND